MDPMEEMKKLPPEVQALIAAKVAEASKQFEAKVLGDVRTEPWISRAWRELTLPKAQPLELASVKAKQDGLRHGMLCLMACKDSGFRARKNLNGMTEVDIQAKADLTVSEVLLIQVLVLAAKVLVIGGEFDLFAVVLFHDGGDLFLAGGQEPDLGIHCQVQKDER